MRGKNVPYAELIAYTKRVFFVYMVFVQCTALRSTLGFVQRNKRVVKSLVRIIEECLCFLICVIRIYYIGDEVKCV